MPNKTTRQSGGELIKNPRVQEGMVRKGGLNTQNQTQQPGSPPPFQPKPQNSTQKPPPNANGDE
jgi:hypothetical protein